MQVFEVTERALEEVQAEHVETDNDVSAEYPHEMQLLGHAVNQSFVIYSLYF